MDDRKLIELVRAYKCLYDSNNKNYKDAQIRDYAWKKISNEMKQPGEYCTYFLSMSKSFVSRFLVISMSFSCLFNEFVMKAI